MCKNVRIISFIIYINSEKSNINVKIYQVCLFQQKTTKRFGENNKNIEKQNNSTNEKTEII